MRKYLFPLVAIAVAISLVPTVVMAASARFTSSSASTPAVVGVNSSTASGARGVFGYASGATRSATFGVYGQSASSSGAGVVGTATATTNTIKYGVYGIGHGGKGIGVYGTAPATSGQNIGVYGTSRSPSGFGLYGLHDATSGTAPGAAGYTRSTSSQAVGVLGAVLPTAPGTFSAGVKGVNNGTSNNGVGVYGFQAGTGAGVFGTSKRFGVYGETRASNGFGVYGSVFPGVTNAYAGFFAGNVGISGSLLCVGCVGLQALAFNPATQTELDTKVDQKLVFAPPKFTAEETLIGDTCTSMSNSAIQISAPKPGTIVVDADVVVRIGHVADTLQRLVATIGSVGSVCDEPGSTIHVIPPTAGAGEHWTTLRVRRVFPVTNATPQNYTYNLQGWMTSGAGDDTFYSATLTATFYG